MKNGKSALIIRALIFLV